MERKKIMLLGSGELGKEFTIAAQRYGQWVVAVDRYADAPAMQVAHEHEVIDMLDPEQLDAIVTKHQPDLIVPEIEAIRTEKLLEFEQNGITVVPSAKATNYTMNRKAIRDLAAKDLGIRTAKYKYATNLEEMNTAVDYCGMPCVVKPLMSSSGKGQSVIRTQEDIQKAWDYALEGSRGDLQEVIVEEFIDFHSEITLLTITQNDGPTLFCPPIGHVQERGDYQQSWQPAIISSDHLAEAEEMADKVTKELGGAGIWGVEFFLTNQGAYFSELSPRPHDTGMVTMTQSQFLNEFELHLRAVLGIPIPGIDLHAVGASAVILADRDYDSSPVFEGAEEVCRTPNTDVRLFGKPNARPYRRMGVVLVSRPLGSDPRLVTQEAKELAAKIQLKYP